MNGEYWKYVFYKQNSKYVQSILLSYKIKQNTLYV